MLMQALINGLSAGALVAIIGIGYALISSCGMRYHFAHAAVFAVGAYTFQFSAFRLPNAVLLCAGLSCVAAVALGVAVEWLIYRRLLGRSSSHMAIILSSFGLYVIVQNLLALCFGDATRLISIWPTREGWPVLGARITALQALTIVAALVFLGIFRFREFHTRAGANARATGIDLKLAKVVGVNMSRTMVWAMVLGSLAAGVAGVLATCDTGVFPTMGLMPFFAALVGTVVARESTLGTVACCLAISVLQAFAILWIGAEWKDSIVFGILILVLLSRHRVRLAESPEALAS